MNDSDHKIKHTFLVVLRKLKKHSTDLFVLSILTSINLMGLFLLSLYVFS